VEDADVDDFAAELELEVDFDDDEEEEVVVVEDAEVVLVEKDAEDVGVPVTVVGGADPDASP